MQGKTIELLEGAISDVGYWRYWDARLPDVFQAEFGGAQLWNPPASPDGPPSGLVALRVISPTLVAFLRRADLPDDWFDALHRDELEPFGIGHDTFSIGSRDRAREWCAESTHTHTLVGSTSLLAGEGDEALFAFWAGPVGLCALGARIDVMTMSGAMDDAAIEEANAKWWTYWHDYWARRETPAALPKDYACEVTIPLARS